jgi:4-hydroxy-2-oxoheptanedioate aldolase
MKNGMKDRLLSGKVVVGVQLRFGSAAIAELFGNAGFDYVVIDAEHAPQTPVGIQQQLQALGSTPATPVVRLLQNDPAAMRTYLDMGALSILVPFVNTAEEARMGSQGMRYPPSGTRGYGPSRASKFGLDASYFRTADQDMLYLALIEDERAVRNIDEILAVDGVDAIVIGPVDLSISLGVPMQFDHPRFEGAVHSIIKAGLASKKPVGTGIYGADMFDPNTYKHFADKGLTILLTAGDEWVLQTGAKRLAECSAAVRH